jgi:hypothetical protein
MVIERADLLITHARVMIALACVTTTRACENMIITRAREIASRT